MQFVDGGNIDSHAKRVMEAQAQAAGNGGVGDVYRTVRVAFDGTRKRNGNMLISWVEKSKSELRSGFEFREDMKVSGGRGKERQRVYPGLGPGCLRCRTTR